MVYWCCNENDFLAASHAQMRPIATDVASSVVCVSVCVLVIRMHCDKMAESTEIPSGG